MRKLFWTLFLIGLAIRIWLTSLMGNADMYTYHEWGDNVLRNGLSGGYVGIYFPLQYQFFSFCSWVSSVTGIDWVIVYKLYNLVYEIGVFALLIKILDYSSSKNRWYSLLYWLHPWFILNYSNGFIDSQFTFFLLLSMYVLHVNFRSKYGYLIAGIPYAAVFLLKPQILMVTFSLFIYLFFVSIKEKVWLKMLFFVPSIVLFGVYMLYFMAAKYQTGIIYSTLFLSKSYLKVIDAMPCLTCSLPNIWYPYADYLSEGLKPVYAVSSRIVISSYGFTFETIALTLSILAVVLFCYKMAKLKGGGEVEKIQWLILFVSLFIPFVMTGAHINHPYVAIVFLLMFLAKYNNFILSITLNLLMITLAAYLYSSYEFGLGSINVIPSIVSYIPSKLTLSYISITTFVITILIFLKIVMNNIYRNGRFKISQKSI